VISTCCSLHWTLAARLFSVSDTANDRSTILGRNAWSQCPKRTRFAYLTCRIGKVPLLCMRFWRAYCGTGFAALFLLHLTNIKPRSCYSPVLSLLIFDGPRYGPYGQMASLSEGLTAPRQPLPREYSSVELFSIQAAARILNVPTSELFRLAETIANTTNASCHIEPYRFNVLSNPPVIHHPIPTHAGTSSTLAPGPSQSTVHPTAEKGVVNGSAGQSSSILTSDGRMTCLVRTAYLTK
jgi:hypothetical protein